MGMGMGMRLGSGVVVFALLAKTLNEGRRMHWGNKKKTSFFLLLSK